MFLNKLQLKNFRNYENCLIEFKKDKSLIIGKNAQGKTNILEAIYYLSSLKSKRAKSDNEMIKWNEENCFIKGEIKKNDTEIELDVFLNPPNRKVLKVNSIKKNKTSEFISNLTVVNFSVSDLLLLRGVPQDRRDWLDDSISQIYPAYNDRLAKFNKIKTQRNNFLKGLKGNINLSETQNDFLDIWDSQLIISGSNLIFLRLKFLNEIKNKAVLKHLEISGNENLSMVYNSTVVDEFNIEKDKNLTIEEIAEKYAEKLKIKKNEEIIRAKTLVGPHRDDISFFINDRDSKSFASQGQQRTIVLALKLAELDIIKDKTGENPLLLLDDVLAELDDNRQNYLLNSITNNIQTIITSVDTIHFKEEYLYNVEIFKVKSGNIE